MHAQMSRRTESHPSSARSGESMGTRPVASGAVVPICCGCVPHDGNGNLLLVGNRAHLELPAAKSLERAC